MLRYCGKTAKGAVEILYRPTDSLIILTAVPHLLTNGNVELQKISLGATPDPALRAEEGPEWRGGGGGREGNERRGRRGRERQCGSPTY